MGTRGVILRKRGRKWCHNLIISRALEIKNDLSEATGYEEFHQAISDRTVRYFVGFPVRGFTLEASYLYISNSVEN